LIQKGETVMKSDINEKNKSRRKFVKNATVGVAGAAVMGSPSCSESAALTRDRPQTESSGRAMTREQFLKYIDYFNRKDFESVASYFNPDVTVEYPDNFMGPQTTTARTLRGPKEFIKNYQALTAKTREVLNLGVFLSQGNHFCVELITEFTPLKTPAAGAAGTQSKEGETRILNQCVIYDLDEKGKFKRIRIFHHRHLDPETAKRLLSKEAV
jgi:hypothetical protein